MRSLLSQEGVSDALALTYCVEGVSEEPFE